MTKIEEMRRGEVHRRDQAVPIVGGWPRSYLRAADVISAGKPLRPAAIDADDSAACCRKRGSMTSEFAEQDHAILHQSVLPLLM